MAIWEYKVISSGKGGFANPQMLENFLNQLGKDEWEIISYRTPPENALAFNGLARRSTQRDWTLEAAAAAQAKAEEERRRAEERAEQLARDLAADRQSSARPAPAAAAAATGDGQRDERLRTYRDTELDNDPEALAEEAGSADDLPDWEEMQLDDDLPSLFDAIKPHLRRNPKGVGEAAALDYLAKRWDQETDDVLGALKECGFTVPESEDAPPDYFEFEGDLFWLNCNNRGQLFINVREKPRPRFKPSPMRKLDPDDPAAAELRAEYDAEQDKKRTEREAAEARDAERAAARAAREAAQAAEAAKPAEPLPEGLALLDILIPKMRRNRRGPGLSGTVGFMAKALKRSEESLLEALAAIGLHPAEDDGGKPAFVEAGDQVYWLKKDGRGGVWINSRDKDRDRGRNRDRSEGEAGAPESGGTDADRGTGPESVDEAVDAAADTDTDADADIDADANADSGVEDAGDESGAEPVTVDFTPGVNALPALRLLLKVKTRGSGAAAGIDALARRLGRPAVEILEALVKAGLQIPDTSEEKPVFVELGDEILWLNRSAKDDALWLNAKARQKRGARGRGRRREDGEAGGESGDTAGAPSTATPAMEAPAAPESGPAAGPEEPPADPVSTREPTA